MPTPLEPEPCLRCGDFPGEAAFSLPPAALCEPCLSCDGEPWTPPFLLTSQRGWAALRLLLATPVFILGGFLGLALNDAWRAVSGGRPSEGIALLSAILGGLFAALLATLVFSRWLVFSGNPAWLEADLATLNLSSLRGREGLRLDLAAAWQGATPKSDLWTMPDGGILITTRDGLAFLSRSGARAMLRWDEVEGVTWMRSWSTLARRELMLTVKPGCGRGFGALRLGLLTEPTYRRNNRRAAELAEPLFAAARTTP